MYVGNQLQSHGLSPTNADILPPLLRAEGYAVVVTSNKWKQLSRLTDMLKTTYTHRRKVDAVLIDTYSTRNFYYAVAVATLCRRFKIPYFPILRGGNLPERIQRSKRLSNRLFGSAAVNVAPSRYLLEGFKKAGYENLVYIPNSIPLENYRFKLREQPQYKLLWVRSFAAIYNPMMAVRVVELLRDRGMSVSLCMVGPDKDGTMQECKAAAEEKGLDIQFTGMLPKEEWISRSRDYDIFISTTNFDNTPVSVIEAMALGLPVISTNVGGVPFLVDHNKTGLLVPPDDSEGMVEAIASLVNEPGEAVRLARNARKLVEGFDWEVVKRMWGEVLD